MVYVLLGKGFEETEAIAPVDLLRRANIPVLTVGIGGNIVEGSHSIPVVADITVEEMDLTQMDMLVLPGGLGGVASIMASEASMNAVRFAWENGKFLGAICAGPTILASLGILDGKNATCYPGCEDKMGKANILPQAAVTDGSIITGTSAGCALPFGLALIAALKGEAEAERIKDQIVIR